MRVCEQMKEIGARWNALNHIEKAEYEKKAKLDRDRYEEELAQLPRLPPSAVILNQPRRRVRRQRKDPNKPRKVLSPYILFVKERRADIAKSPEAIGKSFGEIMKMLGDAWKKLPQEEK